MSVLLVGLTFLFPRAVRGLSADLAGIDRVVRTIESNDFSSSELAPILEALQLEIGKEIDPIALDQRVKQLLKRGQIQSILIEVAERSDGLLVTVRGTKTLKLHDVIFADVITEGREIFRRRPGFEPGKPIDTGLINTFRDRLKSVYSDHGYYLAVPDVSIKELGVEQQADVRISVARGTPTRIRNVKIVGGDPKLNSTLKDQIALRANDVLQKHALGAALERLREFLRENQYRFAKVEEAELAFSSDMSEVDVVITVRYGERVQYIFSGNRVFSDRELRSLLTPEVLTQPEPTVRLSKLITDKYRQIGFYYCEVEVVERPSAHDGVKYIELVVSEGERVRIRRLTFDSTEPLSEDLESLFFSSAGQSVIGRGLYYPDLIPQVVEQMRKELSVKGYLNTRLQEPKVVFSQDRRSVDLLFDVDLGRQAFINSITFSGNTFADAAMLTTLLSIRPGQPFNIDMLADDRRTLQNFYVDSGYVDFAFKNTLEDAAELSSDRRLISIRFPISEGARYRVGSIEIDGNRRTQTKVILRELKLEKGGVFSPDRMRRSEEAIRLLGLFSRVELASEQVPEDPTVRNIRVIVRENKPGVGEIGVGGWYEEPRLRLRGFFGLAYRNLIGLNQTASVRSEVGLPLSQGTVLPFVEYSNTVGYRAPYIFDWPLTFSTQVGLDSFELTPSPSSILTRARIENRIERQFSSWLTFYYRLHRFERTVTEEEDASSPIGVRSVVERVTIGSTGPSIIADFRDDTFNPTSGSYHVLDFELAHPSLLSEPDVAFVMALARNSFYLPLFSPLSLTLFAGGGYATSISGASSPLPTARLLNELSLGGQASIRGVGPRSMSPPKDTYRTAYINGRAEVATEMFSNLSLAVFFDAGQILPELKPQERRYGVGLGFRYKTPVGPVVVDLAQGLGGPTTPVRFYFTVGSI